MLINSPKVQIFCIHFCIHLCKWIHRSHAGIICYRHFIICFQFFPSNRIKSCLIGPYIQSLIFTYNNIARIFFEYSPSTLTQDAITNHNELLKTFLIFIYKIVHITIHNSIWIIKEKYSQSSSDCIIYYHYLISPYLLYFFTFVEN